MSSSLFSMCPHTELKNLTERTTHPKFAKPSSIKGRVVCAALVPLHGVGVIAKTTTYACLTVFSLGTTILYVGKCLSKKKLKNDTSLKNKRKTCFIKTKNLALCTLISPLGQLAQTTKASLGVISPNAYFKHHKSKPLLECSIIESTLNEVTLVIKCDFASPAVAPFETLKELSAQLKKHNPITIRIIYDQQLGIDAGGLRKDFIHTITEGISTAWKAKTEVVNWSPEKEQQLIDLGILLRYLLKHLGPTSQAQFPIGHKFHDKYFTGLLAFSHADLAKDFNKFSPADLLTITLHQLRDFKNPNNAKQDVATALAYADNENEIIYVQKLLSLLAASKRGFIKDIDIANLLECATQVDENLSVTSADLQHQSNKPSFDHAVAHLIDLYLADKKPKLHTLHTLAKAMNYTESEWNQLNCMRMRDHLQGQLSKEKLKKILTFPGFDLNVELDRQKVTAINQWVDAKSLEELRYFVIALTGTSCLPEKISIKQINVGKSAAHPCNNTLDLVRSFSSNGVTMFLDEFCCAERLGFHIR